ncbi:MupG family TIM beta-alpha barrel fold protein [Spiroplasma culicicola]|uniref:Outer surface protein n=1 Tax=Spiroplasma culicicola AES-1 TaxID=1276246 RepID=W6A6T4_9MOLU|nr:MupG family TIM beta-alpha barrel fold protein [Spiroplasma culicicola]AHI52585.1 hypothetical protein SCULI_v1c02440 [Spiroplasma culicicola AES-1]
MKRNIGISIYPEQSSFEKDKAYLDLAKNFGFKILFTSILHFGNDPEFHHKCEKVFKTIGYAKALGFYVVLDVEENSMKKAGIENDLLKCKEIGVDCIRLDTPLRASEIAMFTFNKAEIDIQLNMSNNDHLITNIMDYKPIAARLNGCHNFYPLKNTALPLQFFRECNQKYLAHRLETSAFVGSHIGEMTTAIGWKELPTIEIQRDLSIKAQAKILFYSQEIDNVLIGNAYASEAEMMELAKVNRYVLTFNIKKENFVTDDESDIILSTSHYRRGDITEMFIRSTMPRIYFKDRDIQPNNKKNKFNIGDIVIINNNDEKYKGELHIILQDDFENIDNKYNYVASIKAEEKILLDYLQANSQFRFEFD